MDHAKAAFQLGMDLGRAPRDEAQAIAPHGTAPRKAQTEASPHYASETARRIDPSLGSSAEAQIVHGPWTQSDESLDHFVHRDGRIFAGTHLIIDLWGADRLDDLDHIEAALRQAVDASGATLLHIHLHHFTPNGGVSGVAVLAESHISVHTWPERAYAAFDVFMCGDAEPEKSVPVFERAFTPDRVDLNTLCRGEITTK